MLVSVFVQAHNTEPYIGECLDTILGQRGSHEMEVVVIDDASTDGTARELGRFRDPRLRVIAHRENLGAIATANEGYAALSGRFVARVDSDDRLRPDFLRLTVPRLLEAPSRGLAYGDIATIDAAGHVTCGGGLVHRHGRPAAGNEFVPLLLENFIPAPATLVRREALLSLLPIPADLRFLDWYITTGIAERWDSFYVDEVIADYRVHAGSMHHAMVLDRSGETTSLTVLDRLFASEVKREEKARWRRRVYATHYLTYAEKYFGCDMNADARRCYWEAIVRRPALLLDAGISRRFAATVIGRHFYESAKARLNRRHA